MTLSEREKGVLVLDKRTSFKLSVLGQADWKSAVKSLEKFYTDYYVQCKHHDHEELRKARGDTAAEGTLAAETADAVIAIDPETD